VNHFPYDIYQLDSYALSYHALARYKQLLRDEVLPFDVLARIEDDIIPALEAIILVHESL
jgi:hypothetical protein